MTTLNEGYHNLFSEQDKEQHKQHVYDLVQSAYALLGCLKRSGFGSPDEMVKELPMWKLATHQGKLVAASLYKDTNGRKRVASATDGSPEGKAKLADIMKSDLTQNRAYSEVSKESLKFHIKQLGQHLEQFMVHPDHVSEILGKPVSKNTDASYLSNYPEWTHKYFYTREIGGNQEHKVMLGTPGKNIVTESVSHDDFNHDKILYHGTHSDIENIDPEKFGKGDDASGPGFYMSTSARDASGYAHTAKPDDKGTGPNVLKVVHAIKNPMPMNHYFKYTHIKQLIAASPHFKEAIQDFKHDDRQSDESALRTHARALHDFQDPYDEQNAPSVIQQIHHDFYRGQHASVLLQKLHELTGHDGMIRKFDNGVEHHVAWFPEQVKVAHAKFEKFGTGTGIQESSEEHPMIDVDGVMKHRHNSEGKPIHPTDEGIRNFHKWFGDSKVVDEHGRPQVMYHGTGKNVDYFKDNTRGVHFATPNKVFANKYAGGEYSVDVGDSPNVMPIYVKANNPFDHNNKNHVNRVSTAAMMSKSAADELKSGKWQRVEDRTTVHYIKKFGHDSLYVSEEGSRNIGVFAPSQIKSAIGNDGSFDHPTKIHESEDYRGQHMSPDPEGGSPLHDVTTLAYPKDFYESDGARNYGAGRHDDSSVHSLIRSLNGRPNASVKIYRAVPHEKSNEELISQYEQHKAHMMKRGTFPPGVDSSKYKNYSEYYDHASNEINRLKSLPEQPAVKHSINPGDWVAISKAYADEHGKDNLNGKYKVVSKTVKAKELFTSGDSFHEWGWHPTIKEDEAPANVTANIPTEPVVTKKKQREILSFGEFIQSRQLKESPEVLDWGSSDSVLSKMFKDNIKIATLKSFEGGITNKDGISKSSFDGALVHSITAKFDGSVSDIHSNIKIAHQDHNKPVISDGQNTPGAISLWKRLSQHEPDHVHVVDVKEPNKSLGLLRDFDEHKVWGKGLGDVRVAYSKTL